MGLTAHFYRTRGKGICTPLSEKNDIQLAYFRNNHGLHRILDMDICLLDLETLEYIKSKAKESQELVDEGYYHGSDFENVNKDWGEGDSVLSVIDKAIEAVNDGYFVYYTASY